MARHGDKLDRRLVVTWTKGVIVVPADVPETLYFGLRRADISATHGEYARWRFWRIGGLA